jgi:phage shock protein A
VSQEETNLAAHVEICAIRYNQIQEKFDTVERRLDRLETDISNLKTQMQTGFTEIKLLLEQRNTLRQTQILASAATIIVALIGAIGYYLTKH